MDAKHALKHHVAIPLGIMAVLLIVGAPLGTAFVVGMMAGCLSMMLMMGSAVGGRHRHSDERDDIEHSSER